MKSLREYIEQTQEELNSAHIEPYDNFSLELTEDAVLDTYVIESWDDSILLAADAGALDILEHYGYSLQESSYSFAGARVGHKEGPAGQWRNKGPKKDKPAQVGDLVGGGSAEESIEEAEYQGRTVPLGKRMPGDVKKSKVYVRKPNGKVVKVNFGDKNMTIKKSNPKRRKSFRARHNCDNPGPRWKARYWSCRAWE
jgi:hypothetical protein